MMNRQRTINNCLQAILAIALGFGAYAAQAGQTTPPAKAVATPPESMPTMALIQSSTPDNAPFSPELKKWLAKNNVKVLTLIDAQGQTRAIDAEGKEIKPCGKIDGTRITGDCQFSGMTPTATNSIRIQGFIPSAAIPQPVKTSKAAVDDPCIGLDIGGALIRYCFR